MFCTPLPHSGICTSSILYSEMESNVYIKQEEKPASLSLENFAPQPSSSSTPSGLPENATQPMYYQNTGLYRQVPLASSARDTRRLYPVPDPSPIRMPSTPAIKISLLTTPKLSPKLDPDLSLPPPPSPRRSHIPRPPNAFMLYRSDFLKRNVIPAHVERRQQHLSRVAGECWNLLSLEEKAQWQERAAEALEEHQRKNPNYKFSPAPRGMRRVKGKITRPSGEKSFPSDRVRQIREEYTRIASPTPTPSRQRRTRSKLYSSDTEQDKASTDDMLPRSLPAFPMSSPAPTPFFPQYPFPQVVMPRRPSTSLGVYIPSDHSDMNQASSLSGSSLPRSAAPLDASLFSQIHDLGLPEVTNFCNIFMPTPTEAPSFTTPFTDLDFSTIHTQTPFNPSFPELSPTQLNPPSQASEMHLQDAKDTSVLYSDDAFPGTLSFDKPGLLSFEASWFSDPFGGAGVNVWNPESAPSYM